MKYIKKIISILMCIGITYIFFVRCSCYSTLEECEVELKKTEDKISHTNNLLKQYEEEDASLKNQIREHTKQIENYNLQIDLCRENIRLTNIEIENKKAEIENKKQKIFNQLTMQQKIKNSNIFLSVLSSANSITSFTNTLNVIQKISLQEKKDIEELKKLKEKLEELNSNHNIKLQQIEDSKKNIEILVNEKQKKKEELQKNIAEQETVLNMLSADEEEINRQRRLLLQPVVTPFSNEGNNIVSDIPQSGNWTLPVDSGAVITARFMSPTYLQEIGFPHRGTDIALYKGAPIYSIADGRVLVTGRYGPLGNLVAVGHIVDNVSYVSVYAHLNAIYTYEGAYVNGGAMIGTMGGSGYSDNSYAPHLHLEIAYRDYFTTNINVRNSTNFEVLDILPWKGHYRENPDAW